MNSQSDGLGLVTCAAGLLLLRAGMGMYTVGLVRAKNAAATVLRGVVDWCLAVLVFWAVGLALLGPTTNTSLDDRAVGPVNPALLLGGTFRPPPAVTEVMLDPGADVLGLVLLMMVAVPLGTGIVVGALAERCRFFRSLAVTLLLAGGVIPLAGHWVWFGWLRDLGFTDAGGAAVLHLPGALAAAVGALVVGPRSGKYNRDGSTSAIPGHSVPLASTGTILMAVGWLPYLAGLGGLLALGGGRAGHLPALALNVVLAAAAGGLAGLAFAQFRYAKPDVHVAHAGLLGALVAITAPAHVVAGWQALLIGAVAGVLVPFAIAALDLYWKLDDPGGGVAVHGAGALWGVLAAGLFRPADSLADWAAHLGVQALGLAVVAALAVVTSMALFALLKRGTGLRVRDADEYDGMDIAEHDASSYPDFNQTMIKSY